MMTFKSLAFGAAILGASALSIASTSPYDLLETAANGVKFSTFVKLVDKAGLSQDLKGSQDLTVLAPDDQAFIRFSMNHPKAYRMLMNDTEMLKRVLEYHIIKGSMSTRDLKSGSMVETLDGSKLKFSEGNGDEGTRINDNATVKMANLKASNGMFDEIDRVLIPPKYKGEIMGEDLNRIH